jgi:hypothetical protein
MLHSYRSHFGTRVPRLHSGSAGHRKRRPIGSAGQRKRRPPAGSLCPLELCLESCRGHRQKGRAIPIRGPQVGNQRHPDGQLAFCRLVTRLKVQRGEQIAPLLWLASACRYAL